MWSLFKTDLKMLTRNRQALFFALIFPLLFTFIFGFFFGKNSSGGTIEIIDKAKTPASETMVNALKDAEIFNINDGTDLSKSQDEIKRGKLSAVILIPEKFGTALPDAPTTVTLAYDQGNAQVGIILSNFLDKYLTDMSFQVQNAKPIFSVDLQKVGSNNKLSYFDFVLAGILGLALMNSSVVGIAVGMSKYREDKILKRITTTPVKPLWFILAEVASRLVLNVIQISLILAIGIFFFDGHIYGNYFILYALAILGAILFQLIGFMIASFVKTTDAAQGAAMAVTIPMMFLAGVFFPVDALPKWLYSVVQYLPLAPLLKMIRGVALESQSPFFVPSNIIIVLAWIIIALLISSYKFRLNDE